MTYIQIAEQHDKMRLTCLRCLRSECVEDSEDPESCRYTQLFFDRKKHRMKTPEVDLADRSGLRTDGIDYGNVEDQFYQFVDERQDSFSFGDTI